MGVEVVRRITSRGDRLVLGLVDGLLDLLIRSKDVVGHVVFRVTGRGLFFHLQLGLLLRIRDIY